MAPAAESRPLIARATAILFAIAAAGLAVYSLLLAYAAATFDGDSLPGPTVLYMVAIALALGALLCGGLARLLWGWARGAKD